MDELNMHIGGVWHLGGQSLNFDVLVVVHKGGARSGRQVRPRLRWLCALWLQDCTFSSANILPCIAHSPYSLDCSFPISAAAVLFDYSQVLVFSTLPLLHTS